MCGLLQTRKSSIAYLKRNELLVVTIVGNKTSVLVIESLEVLSVVLKEMLARGNGNPDTSTTYHFTHDESIDPTTWHVLVKHIGWSVTTTKQVPATRGLLEDRRSSGSLITEDEGLCSLSSIAADIAKTTNVTKKVRVCKEKSANEALSDDFGRTIEVVQAHCSQTPVCQSEKQSR